MRDLIKQEQFELEVLDRLNSKRLLRSLVFGGGSMLRLCFGLDRFSVDLDFWITKDVDRNKLFKDIKECLAAGYAIKDAADKFYTLLFEIRSKNYPRSLKIEIRKEKKKIKTEKAIAYSRFSNIQVILKAVALQEMMKAKLEALLDRREIRDAFDMEFLLKKGAELNAPLKSLKCALKEIQSFSKKDFTVKLGPLLEEKNRRYYATEGFKILEAKIKEQIAQNSTK